jgi:hypothetical protein
MHRERERSEECVSGVKVAEITAGVTFVRGEIHTAFGAIRGADTSNVSGLVQG